MDAGNKTRRLPVSKPIHNQIQQSNKDLRLPSSRPFKDFTLMHSPHQHFYSPSESSTAFGHALLTCENLVSRPHCPREESVTKTSKLVRPTSYPHSRQLHPNTIIFELHVWSISQTTSPDKDTHPEPEVKYPQQIKPLRLMLQNSCHHRVTKNLKGSMLGTYKICQLNSHHV